MPGAVLHAAVLAFAVGTVAQISSQSQISQPLRKALLDHGTQSSKWIFELLSCPFCVSVWLAAAGCAIFRVRLMVGFWLLDWGCTFLAVAGAAMLPVMAIRKALKL